MGNKLIAKNVFYQALARSATAFIGFIITILIAAKFGAIGFGEFAKVTSYVALFYLFVDFGLNAFYLQYEKVNFKSFFYLRILISFIFFLVLNLLVFILPFSPQTDSGFSPMAREGIFLFSLSIFAQAVVLSASAVFQKRLNYFSYMVGLVIGAIVNLSLVLIFVFLNFSLFYVYTAFVISSISTALILLFLTREKILPPKLDLTFAKDILIKSLPLGFMLIFNLVYFRIDMLLLSVFSPTADVGIYGLAYKFFDFLIALPLFISNAIYPLLLKEKNTKAIFASTKKYFFIFLLFSLVILVPFWFASPLFSLIKSDFVSSVMPFKILLLSLPIFYVTSLFQWVLISLGRQKYLMYVYLISMIVNILLNLIFIPKYSYIASATITLVTEAIVFILLTIKILQERKKQIHD